jgi:hypothetical protein
MRKRLGRMSLLRIRVVLVHEPGHDEQLERDAPGWHRHEATPLVPGRVVDGLVGEQRRHAAQVARVHLLAGGACGAPQIRLDTQTDEMSG